MPRKAQLPDKEAAARLDARREAEIRLLIGTDAAHVAVAELLSELDATRAKLSAARLLVQQLLRLHRSGEPLLDATVFWTIEATAQHLSLSPAALLARIERSAAWEHGELVSRPALGVEARKVGNLWRLQLDSWRRKP